MKENNNFLSLSIMIILFISLILILYFYYIKNYSSENFQNSLNYEILLPGWNYNKNTNPKTNPSLLKPNHFKQIPDDLITWTPYTISKYGQQNYNAYFYKNNYMYPLY